MCVVLCTTIDRAWKTGERQREEDFARKKGQRKYKEKFSIPE